ncbi:DUF3822 family protein [Aquimarina hainanensis]|uniref:DUF3822 family protein n=1 Tax=Aquimarina hainanensis TaxID=1578017 RepID=A0ABW5NA56_9FLAO
MDQTISNTTDNTIHRLSIQVSLNGLSFCTANEDNEILYLYEKDFGTYLSPEQTLKVIKDTFNTQTVLHKACSTVEVLYANDLYTFVPKALFSEVLLKEYLRYNVKILATDFITYDALEQHELITVYVPYANINNFFFDTYGSFTYKHISTVLADRLLTQEKHSETVKMFVHVSKKTFEIIVINKGKFVLGNTYIYQTKEDFLYYLLFTAEQLQLNPEEFELVFLGAITKDSELYNIAYTYIRNIRFGESNIRLKNPGMFPTFEPHQHYTLLNHF